MVHDISYIPIGRELYIQNIINCITNTIFIDEYVF